MEHVEVKPSVLQWARERANIEPKELLKNFRKYEDWENGEGGPSFSQLQKLSHKLKLPIGYFFLSEPPKEKLPVADFRTMESRRVSSYSSELIDTIYLCQRRQSWYRSHLSEAGALSLPMVASESSRNRPEDAAERIRLIFNVTLENRRTFSNWTDFFRAFVRNVREQKILVMISGVYGNNTHRKLDPDEFRGFALVDDYAPLIFINGADTKAAQIFTLAHELAHIFLGKSGVSKPSLRTPPVDFTEAQKTEKWCNAVAAETLVPLDEISKTPAGDTEEKIDWIARSFKVSRLVAVRRLLDGGIVDRDEFERLYRQMIFAYLESKAGSSGGNFHHSFAARSDPNFAKAIISSTFSGETLIGDALDLLSIKKVSTLRSEASKLKDA